ncbi:MAG: FAD-binding protein [Anaerolineae bacterium]
MNLQPASPAEVQAIVRAQPQLLARGGGSKPALSSPPPGIPCLDLSRLRGVLEYQPEEYTFTALAGTPVAEVTALLAGHGQSLPFDPILAGRGATLGGTVAAGASGPGRYRFGGVRDFLLGVRFVDGAGHLIRGGGRVVKNAAGFDLPKLMVGSLGRLGVLLELTFKVFPRPPARATLEVNFDAGLEAALAAMVRLTTSPLDLEALDLEPPGKLWIRLGGPAAILPARLDRLQTLTGGGQVHTGSADEVLWRAVRDFHWLPQGWSLAKVPLTPRQIPGLDERLAAPGARRRYSVGGNLAWIAWPDDPGALDEILRSLDLAGLALTGPAAQPWLGLRTGAGGAFGQRVKQALDPAGRFPEV